MRELCNSELFKTLMKEYKIGLSHRFMKPGKNGVMQHCVPDEWNAWSIQKNSIGKFSVVNRSNITPVLIPRHHTRNGRIVRLGILSDPSSGKISFVNATIRPRRIIYSIRPGTS